MVFLGVEGFRNWYVNVLNEGHRLDHSTPRSLRLLGADRDGIQCPKVVR